MNKKFIAFTLAEVLIVTAVIGVIGALTLPNLKKSYGANSNKAKANAAYTKINSALQQIDMSSLFRGLDFTSDGSCMYASERLYNQLKTYLKLSADCSQTSNTTKMCFPDSIVDTTGYVQISGTFNDGLNGDSCYGGVLNDGTVMYVCVRGNKPYLDSNSGNNIYGNIYIDTNGKDAPNTRGQDIFVFQIGEDGLELLQRNGWAAQMGIEDEILAADN